MSIEPDWAAIRGEFPALGRFAYLDIAKKAILPRQAQAAAQAWFRDIDEEAGGRAFSMEEVEATRGAVAALVGAPVETVALIKNTSEGMNIIAQGMAFERGDNVVLSELEHENNTFPWRKLEEKGVELRWVRPDNQGRTPVSAYERHVDRRTRVVTVAWVVYGNGFRNDIPGLAALCKAHGARLVVDGMQALGFLSTPFTELGADAMVSGGHKALFSLAGAGLMVVREDFIPEITPPYGAKYSYQSNDRMQASPAYRHDAQRFDYGNPNFLGCWVQRRSAEWLMGIGLEAIEARIEAVTDYLIEGADRQGIAVRTPRPWAERGPIVSFDVGSHRRAGGRNATELVARLRERDVCVSEKDGHVRAAVGLFNNHDDIDRLLLGLSEES